MIPVLETKDLIPICPHCQAQIQSVYAHELQSQFGRRYIYFCPQCRKVLGVSHRKGFWMG